MNQNNIPAAAWVVILCMVSMIVLLNISLITAWRRKNTGLPGDILDKTRKVLQNPWQKEDDSLAELARKAEKIKKMKEVTYTEINRNDHAG